jgi:RHS repeat-associated protein
MRNSTGVQWLLGDHLGSTSGVVNASGVVQSTQLYKPWGESRYSSSASPTKYLYTGQMKEGALGGAEGLYYYGARWYDPSLGRFAQADTIVPVASHGTQAWDRFAYTNNNPVRYNDPSGHCLILCTAIIGGAIGAIVGAVGYTAYTIATGNEFNTGTMLLAAGGGAVAGALIGTGVGIAAGIEAAGMTTEVVMGTAACGDGDCTNEVVSLYRAISSSELDDIVSNNVLQPKLGGGSMDAKWFWEGLDSAKDFMAQMPDLNHIVNVKVPSSIINTGYRVPNLDNLGPAVGFIDDALIELNKAIISIREVIAQ